MGSVTRDLYPETRLFLSKSTPAIKLASESALVGAPCREEFLNRAPCVQRKLHRVSW